MSETLNDYAVSAARGINNVGRTFGGVADLISNSVSDNLPAWLTTPIGYYVDSAVAGRWLDKNQPQYQYNPHTTRDLFSADDNTLKSLYSGKYENNALHEVLRQAPTVAATYALSRTPAGVLLQKGASRFSPFVRAGAVNAGMGAGYDHSQGDAFSGAQFMADALLGGYTRHAPLLRHIPGAVANGSRFGNEALQGYLNTEE